jgi:hypothetical protein
MEIFIKRKINFNLKGEKQSQKGSSGILDLPLSWQQLDQQ